MARKKTDGQETSPTEKTEALKSNVSGFRGGLQLDLNRTMESGRTLREELSDHITKVLSTELRNHEGYYDKVRKWEEQYSGHRPPKSSPFPDCSNISIPISRSDVDTLLVRIYDGLFNKKKLILVKALKPEFVDYDRKIEDALNHYAVNILKFKEKILPALIQCVKLGTGIIYFTYEEKKRVVYRYANDDELTDSKTIKYALSGTKDKAVASIQTLFQGPNIYPVLRDRFISSSDAANIEDAYIIGFRAEMRKAEMMLKARQGLYDMDESKKLSPPEIMTDEIKDSRAEQEGKEIKKIDATETLNIWNLWLRYDVNEDGDPDDIKVTFHLGTGAILKAIYNPLFMGFRPFENLTFFPKETGIDGIGVCEITYPLQAAIDTIENQRIDRATLINSLIVLVRAGTELEAKLKNLKPQQVISVDDDLDGCVREIKFSDTYPSTITEENMLVAYADRAIGITPGVMGISTSERPVAKETYALIEEANKKFKYGIENVRIKVVNIFYKLLDFFAQYQPRYTYFEEGAEGKLEERTVDFPLENIRDGFKIELAASTELESQETRRQVDMTVYTIVSDYLTKLAGMGQMVVSPQVPQEFKELLYASSAIGRKILVRILEDFDQRDAEELAVELSQIISKEQAMMASQQQMMMQQQAQMQAQQGGGQVPPQAPQGGMQQ